MADQDSQPLQQHTVVSPGYHSFPKNLELLPNGVISHPGPGPCLESDQASKPRVVESEVKSSQVVLGPVKMSQGTKLIQLKSEVGVS